MTLRANEEDKTIVERLRNHLIKTNGTGDDAAILRFSIRAADREISRQKHKQPARVR